VARSRKAGVATINQYHSTGIGATTAFPENTEETLDSLENVLISSLFAQSSQEKTLFEV
jgi:hypothetical protein